MWIVPVLIIGGIVWAISTTGGSGSGNGNGNGNGNGEELPEVGGTTDVADGTYFEFPNRAWLVAFGGIWWRGGSGRACHQNASGLTVTHANGRQSVCAENDSGMNVWRPVPQGNTAVMLFDDTQQGGSSHASENNYQGIKKI